MSTKLYNPSDRSVGVEVLSTGEIALSSADSGTAEATTSAVHRSGVIKSVITLTDVPVTVSNTTGVSFGGTKVFTFPEGRILVHGATVGALSLTLATGGTNATPLVGTMGGDFAFGTAVPDDGLLDDTAVDIIPSHSADPLSGGAGAAALAASAQFDGTTTPVAVYVNAIIDDGDVADTANDEFEVSGDLTIVWSLLGDY